MKPRQTVIRLNSYCCEGKTISERNLTAIIKNDPSCESEWLCNSPHGILKKKKKIAIHCYTFVKKKHFRKHNGRKRKKCEEKKKKHHLKKEKEKKSMNMWCHVFMYG